MLIEFAVENFRSFKERQLFSMEPGEEVETLGNAQPLTDDKLLKSATIFGANANGKTNLLRALSTLRELVVRAALSELDELPAAPFADSKEPTKFEIVFQKATQRFEYYISYDHRAVSTEKLVVDHQVVFQRQGQDFQKVPSALATLTSNIRQNQLLLFYAQQNNDPVAKLAYEWFAKDLVLVNLYPDRDYQYGLFKALEDPKFKARYLLLLQAADFNISNIEVRENERVLPGYQALPNELHEPRKYKFYDVYVTHQGKGGPFTIGLGGESTGTQIFMVLVLYLLNSKGKTLLVDEFDQSYHLALAQALLQLINSSAQTNQFILTTHTLSLMDCDLRQDQIWLVEKNRFGESNLVSLYDFDDTELTAGHYRERYLAGYYGATQLIDPYSLTEALKDE